ncbi:hypothetical protein ACFO9E_12715 [Streptomyces maoxianensis]|uniref:Uncharacterized protein n=1 Tax=Streptomyces maoxianensis TaxID=1459942 RepID=A0ABV9G6X3_9ACTN
MRTLTTMTPPVHLPEPTPEPTPMPGCGVCTALVKQREAARQRHDLSAVSDANVELRNHTHGGDR